MMPYVHVVNTQCPILCLFYTHTVQYDVLYDQSPLWCLIHMQPNMMSYIYKDVLYIQSPKSNMMSYIHTVQYDAL